MGSKLDNICIRAPVSWRSCGTRFYGFSLPDQTRRFPGSLHFPVLQIHQPNQVHFRFGARMWWEQEPLGLFHCELASHFRFHPCVRMWLVQERPHLFRCELASHTHPLLLRWARQTSVEKNGLENGTNTVVESLAHINFNLVESFPFNKRLLSKLYVMLLQPRYLSSCVCDNNF